MTQVCPVCKNEVTVGEAVCSACGYKLLGATQAFQPIVIEGEAASSAENERPNSVLKIVRGPQRGVSYALTEELYDLGRSPHCAVFLNDMTVSRLHAFIVKEGSGYLVRDNNSYNGVWVNNQNVESKRLEHGDCIQVGTFCLRYEESK